MRSSPSVPLITAIDGGNLSKLPKSVAELLFIVMSLISFTAVKE